MAAPLVSIIVRTCPGRAGMAREAVASIMAQTWRPLELIVAEDGGATAAAWLAEVGAGDVDIHHLPLAKAGRSAAGNAALAAARGKFVGFLDDDDLFYPKHVATLAAALIEAPEFVAAYATAVEMPTSIDDWSKPAYRQRRGYVAHCKQYSRELLARTNFLPIQSVLFRRSLFEAYGGFTLELDQLEDWDLWRRYSAGGDFRQVAEITSLYRVPATADLALERHRKLRSYVDTLRAANRLSDASAAGIARAESSTPLAVVKSALRDCLLSNRWLYRGYWHARQLYFSKRFAVEASSCGTLYA